MGGLAGTFDLRALGGAARSPFEYVVGFKPLPDLPEARDGASDAQSLLWGKFATTREGFANSYEYLQDVAQIVDET
jgi:hypothetical protein